MGIITDITKARPSRIRTRQLNPNELGFIRQIMGRMLGVYGLKLRAAEKESLSAVATNPQAKMGPLQREYRYPLALLHGLGAAAVAMSGLGLGKTDDNKRMVDRSAAGVHGVGLDIILADTADNRVAVVAAAEGERVKPGEKGGNPARFRGEVFGPQQLRENFAAIADGSYHRDVQVIQVVTDDVDGTGKATEGKHSSVTSSLYTMSGAKPLPDEYMSKVVSSRWPAVEITPQSEPRELVDVFAAAHGVRPRELNFFSLTRPRHAQMIEAIARLGPNFVQDKDGDVMPAIAAALGEYLYPNGYPLHGLVANVGGAAEAGMLLPIVWRGGYASVEFVSKAGLKSDRWEDRYNFSDREIEALDEYGFEGGRPFQIETLFADPFADGTSFYGGVTDNFHLDASPETGRGLLGVEVKGDALRVHTAEISSSGRAEIIHAVFDYAVDLAATRAAMTPLVTRLRQLGSENEVATRVAEMLKADARRMQIEFGQDYYLAIDVRDGCFRIDNETYASLRAEGVSQRFDQRDDAIVAAVKEQAPDWFII